MWSCWWRFGTQGGFLRFLKPRSFPISSFLLALPPHHPPKRRVQLDLQYHAYLLPCSPTWSIVRDSNPLELWAPVNSSFYELPLLPCTGSKHLTHSKIKVTKCYLFCQPKAIGICSTRSIMPTRTLEGGSLFCFEVNGTIPVMAVHTVDIQVNWRIRRLWKMELSIQQDSSSLLLLPFLNAPQQSTTDRRHLLAG